jgi:hypothetical protein
MNHFVVILRFSPQWATFLDSEGWVVDSKDLKERIFHGGMEHSLRQEVFVSMLTLSFLALLGSYPCFYCLGGLMVVNL